MDLRVYYQRIRAVQADLTEPCVVIVSKETPDGGKAGVKTDVPKALAARMIVEDRAVLASPEETAQFRGEVAQRWRDAEEQGFEEPLPVVRTKRQKKV